MITITTDFGYQDHYVGVMKGVILGINPRAIIADVTHGVRRHDIRHASYILRSIIDYFPEDAVHLFVVDPGVGTKRRGIVAELDRGFFVGPDNGILTLVKSRVRKVYLITLKAENPTFHGRDIFAPVAARVDMGDFSELVAVDDFSVYEVQEAARDGEFIRGEILHVDHFGNVITNIPKTMVEGAEIIEFHGMNLRMVRTYGDARRGELVAIINSENFLEFAVNQGSAEKILNLMPGDRVEVKIK